MEDRKKLATLSWPSWVTPPSHMVTFEPLAVWRASVTARHDEIGFCICVWSMELRQPQYLASISIVSLARCEPDGAGSSRI